MSFNSDRFDDAKTEIPDVNDNSPKIKKREQKKSQKGSEDLISQRPSSKNSNS